MGGGASKKAFNLCELLRRDDTEEEAAEFIEKANPKTFVIGEYDGRIPFALAAKLGKARFVKQMFARDEDRQYLYGMYLDGALLSSCEGQTDSGNFLHTLRFANIKRVVPVHIMCTIFVMMILPACVCVSALDACFNPHPTKRPRVGGSPAQ